jgi:solute:Na+ symporter, SSS family
VLLRTAIACTSMVSGILAVTYFAVGGGKFVAEFVEFPQWLGLPSEFWSAAMLMGVAILYTIAAGFTTVVYTDVYQSVFIFSSFVIVSVMALRLHLPATFSVYLPVKQVHGPPAMIEWNVTRADWLRGLPTKSLGLPNESSYSMYNSFEVIVATYLIIQCMRSASGPGGSGLQTVLATKSEKEVRLQTFLAMVLMALRWAFSGGIAVMAIHYTVNHSGFVIDPERVVPIVIDKMLPEGIKGFVLASLLAAALTTFDTTINSASAYWTVDIYQALINPEASERRLLWHARFSTIFIMAAGLALSLHVNTINRVWGFITIAMAGAFVWPYFFSWYWSRFNALGYLCGVLCGFVAAIGIFTYVDMLL